MITHGILNAQLAGALARLRHTDRFAVGDCGLPTPPGVEVVDLALAFGVPRFTQVLDALKDDLVLEEALMASEAEGTAAQDWVTERFDVPLAHVPHDGDGGFKDRLHGVSFVIRTGETTPYANVIFRCGVPF